MFFTSDFRLNSGRTGRLQYVAYDLGPLFDVLNYSLNKDSQKWCQWLTESYLSKYVTPHVKCFRSLDSALDLSNNIKFHDKQKSFMIKCGFISPKQDILKRELVRLFSSNNIPS